jgi:hypothetical protein
MVLPQNQLGSDSEQQTVSSQATKSSIWFFICLIFNGSSFARRLNMIENE